MSGWETSDRKARLPKDWQQLVERVKARDGHRCTKILPSGKRCPRGRTSGHRLEVDHRVPGDDHRMENLRTLCAHHHSKKTAQEGLAAQRLPPVRLRTERHPGEIA